MSQFTNYDPTIRDAYGNFCGFAAGVGADDPIKAAVLAELAAEKAREKPPIMTVADVCALLGAPDATALERHPAYELGFPRPVAYSATTPPYLCKVPDASAPNGYRLEVYFSLAKVDAWHAAFTTLARDFAEREARAHQHALALKATGVVALMTTVLQMWM